VTQVVNRSRPIDLLGHTAVSRCVVSAVHETWCDDHSSRGEQS